MCLKLVTVATAIVFASSACSSDRAERTSNVAAEGDAARGNDLGGEGEPCGTDSDCSSPFICASGLCTSRSFSVDASLPLNPDAGVVGIGGGVSDSGADGACNSPQRRACSDLQGYLEYAQGADGGALELGAGDLTLLVIFDKSGSMASPWDLRDKWQAASDSMVAGMAPYLDNLTIGAILFPTPDACQVVSLEDSRQIDFVPGRQFVSEWVESACLNQPNGSTPMELAFRVADQAILRAQSLGLLSDRFRVVLVTDGEPNCETQSDLLPVFADAWFRNLGVETWVIGLPGSEAAATLLDAIASAGGTTKHTPASDPCEFAQAVGVAAK